MGVTMDEDDLEVGVIGALAAGGWNYYHVRRSDLGLVTDVGFPDIVARHPDGRLLVLELKADRGRYRPGQEAWLAAFRAAGIDSRTIRPDDYQSLIVELTGDRLLSISGGKP